MSMTRIVTVLIVVLCAFPLAAAAQPGPGGGFGAGPGPGACVGPGPKAAFHGGPGLHGNWWAIPKVQEKLGLSDEQVETLNSGSADIRKQEIQVNADMEKARIELNELLRSDTVDETAAKDLAERIGELAGQRAQLETLNRLLIAKTLTPEQRKKVAGFMALRMQERREEGPGLKAELQARKGFGRRGPGPEGAPGPNCPFQEPPPKPESE